MTIGRLEKALYDLGVDRNAKTLFKEDPESFTDRYRLDDSEAAALTVFDVARLQQLGANPMLTMGFWMQLEPSHDMGAYIAALQTTHPEQGEN